MDTSPVIAGTRITVAIVPGRPALTLYDHAGQLPPARERAVARRVRAALAAQLPLARVIVRFGDTAHRGDTDLVRLVAVAVRQTLQADPARAA